jgi:phosphatidylglycerophosphate synthase
VARFTYKQVVEKTTPASNWSKFVAHPVADRMLWLLVNFAPVHPNVVTLAANALGIGAGVAFLRGDRAGFVIGAIAFYLAFCLDAIDGALARLTARTSPTGAWLDTLSDFVRSIVCTACLTIGTFRWDPAVGVSVFALGFALVGVIAFYYYFAEVTQKLIGERPAQLAQRSRNGVAVAMQRIGLVPSPFGLPDLEGVCFVACPLIGVPVHGMWIAVVLGAATRALAAMVVLRRLHERARG